MPLWKSEISFSVKHSSSIPQVKAIIEKEFNERLPGNKIKRHWEGDKFKIAGMGTDGYIEVLADSIVTKVQLHPPLSLMSDTIDKNLHDIINKASAPLSKSTSVAQLGDEDFDHLFATIDGTIISNLIPQTFLSNFGHIYHARPQFLIKPNSSADIVKVIAFAKLKQLTISTRGTGHSQSQHSISDNGILLVMTNMNKISEVNTEEKTIWVEAGAIWNNVVAKTYHHQLSPMVLTNNLEASVGGTLSIAGVGVGSFKYGTQCDNVKELEVITTDGEIHQCSRTVKSELFWGVLATVGQIGIITKAKLNLRPVKSRVRTYYLLYDDLTPLFADVKRIMKLNKWDYIESWASPCPQGIRNSDYGRMPFAKWLFPLHLSVEFNPDEPPDDKHMLEELNYYDYLQSDDNPTPEFLNRLVTVFDIWKRLGTWEYIHPWMETILPEKSAREYIETILYDLPPGINLGGHILLWMVPPNLSNVPLFMKPPEDELLVGFGILPATPLAMWPEVKIRLERASELSCAMGGKRYLSGYINFNKEQWQTHFGDKWSELVLLKKKYDPDNRLNPNIIPLLD